MHQLQLTNKTAQGLIDTRAIEIDGKFIHENCVLEENSELKINGKIIRNKKHYTYLKFYKPKGYISSLNSNVPNSLCSFFQNYPSLAIAGRLDKDSEGLLLLSNDGKWVEQICHPEFEKEKEYQVRINKPATQALYQAFTHGIKIGNTLTKPAICERITNDLLRIVLKEGKNRQIRRICHKMGFEVIYLKRFRIDVYELGHLKSGETLDFQLTKTI